MTRCAALVTLLCASAAAGCFTGRAGSWIDAGPRPATRAELYRRAGLPDAIRVEGDRRYLRYDYAEARGARFGVTPFGTIWQIGRIQRGGSRVWVEVAPDGRVAGVFPEPRAEPPRYRLWPFGR